MSQNYDTSGTRHSFTLGPARGSRATNDDSHVQYEPHLQPSLAKNWLFLATLALAIVGWLTALTSQSILTHSTSLAFLGGYLWFAILLQLLVLLWIALFALSTSPSSSSPNNASQPLANLCSIVIVFAALAVDRHIWGTTAPNASIPGVGSSSISPTARGAQKATAAGWLITLLVDLLWVVYFSSPWGSGFRTLFHRFGGSERAALEAASRPGTGTGPGELAGGKVDPSTASQGLNGHLGSSYAMAPIGDLGSPLMPPGALRNSGVTSLRESSALTGASIDGTRRTSAAISEGRSIATDGRERNVGLGLGNGSGSGVAGGSGTGGVGAGGLGGGASRDGRSIPSTVVEDGEPGEPGAGQGERRSGSPSALVPGYEEGGSGTAQVQAQQQPVAHWKARALYTYSANSNDPTELSFHQGETLDILDKSGRWWSARKVDGRVGIAPSNYLQLV